MNKIPYTPVTAEERERDEQQHTYIYLAFYFGLFLFKAFWGERCNKQR